MFETERDAPLEGQYALASAGPHLPAIDLEAEPDLARRAIGLFAAELRNRRTRENYARAIGRLLASIEERGFRLEDLQPVAGAACVERLAREHAAPAGPGSCMSAAPR